MKPSNIEGIKLVMSPSSMYEVLCEPLARKRKPETAIDAKFSIPFTVAIALVYGEVTLRHFAPQALLDSKVLETAQKITYEVDTKLEAIPGYLQISTEQGKINSDRVKIAYGHPKNPISEEALIAKFMDCTTYAATQISEKDLNKLVQLILHLEDIHDISEIMDCL